MCLALQIFFGETDHDPSYFADDAKMLLLIGLSAADVETFCSETTSTEHERGRERYKIPGTT